MWLKAIKRLHSNSKTFMIYVNRFSSTVLQENQDIQPSTPNWDCETRLLKVAVIGIPNAGKSTFINNLMDRKVCATSSKVHTTQKKSHAIFTEGDAQIVFVDTPGLVSFQEHKRFKLNKSFLKDSKSSLQEADIMGVIHDVSNYHTKERLDIKVIKLLEENKEVPSFLVLNKVDVLKSKRKLLDLTRVLTDSCLNGKPIPGTKSYTKVHKDDKAWPYFKDIFMVSALTGSGLIDVKNYLIKNAKPGKFMYPENIWTDQRAEEIIINSVKAKLLDFLPQEIPYELKPAIEFFEVNEQGIITTVVLVDCPSSKKASLVAGASDGKLRQITESVQLDLQNAFQNYVRIKLVLRTPEKK